MRISALKNVTTAAEISNANPKIHAKETIKLSSSSVFNC